MGRQRRTRDARCAPHPHRAGRHQRRHVERRRAVRRLQAVRARPRERRVRARRVSRIQVDAVEAGQAGLSAARGPNRRRHVRVPFFY
ncbi:hypothetical protein F01_200186 [Burkholderia cenocepacia]|nr:hypothetical protein F01_200186 [Burkholderia cenocepacia]